MEWNYTRDLKQAQGYVSAICRKKGTMPHTMMIARSVAMFVLLAMLLAVVIQPWNQADKALSWAVLLGSLAVAAVALWRGGAWLYTGSQLNRMRRSLATRRQMGATVCRFEDDHWMVTDPTNETKLDYSDIASVTAEKGGVLIVLQSGLGEFIPESALHEGETRESAAAAILEKQRLAAQKNG